MEFQPERFVGVPLAALIEELGGKADGGTQSQSVPPPTEPTWKKLGRVRPPRVHIKYKVDEPEPTASSPEVGLHKELRKQEKLRKADEPDSTASQPEANLLEEILHKSDSRPVDTCPLESVLGDPVHERLVITRQELSGARSSVPQCESALTSMTWSWRTIPQLDPAATIPAAGHPDVSAADIELGTYLGGGAQGGVYAGCVRSTGLNVAVKILKLTSDAAERSAQQEAQIASRVNHPNVVRVFGYHTAGDYFIVVMELVCGDNLSRGALLPREARSVLTQMASAVEALASSQIVHRDIKPANIVRRPDGSCVLVDFGMALDLVSATDRKATFGGTPFYMSPEAFKDEPPATAWDLYSLGVTIIALSARHPLPKFRNWDELSEQKRSGEFDRIVSQMIRGISDRTLRNTCIGLVGPPTTRGQALERFRAQCGPKRWKFWSIFFGSQT